jgi:hypothetical protein
VFARFLFVVTHLAVSVLVGQITGLRNNHTLDVVRIGFILSWFFGFRLLPAFRLLGLSDHRLVVGATPKEVVVGIFDRLILNGIANRLF